MTFDGEGFREYLIEKRYARDTTINYVAQARKSYLNGATLPEHVDEVFASRPSEYRSDMRQALRRYHEYLEASS
jgi:hypothetical protein